MRDNNADPLKILEATQTLIREAEARMTTKMRVLQQETVMFSEMAQFLLCWAFPDLGTEFELVVFEPNYGAVERAARVMDLKEKGYRWAFSIPGGIANDYRWDYYFKPNKCMKGLWKKVKLDSR